jgi:hypothetical protein
MLFFEGDNFDIFSLNSDKNKDLTALYPHDRYFEFAGKNAPLKKL